MTWKTARCYWGVSTSTDEGCVYFRTSYRAKNFAKSLAIKLNQDIFIRKLYISKGSGYWRKEYTINKQGKRTPVFC